MKTLTLIALLTFSLNSCLTISNEFHQIPSRVGQLADSALDTLVRTSQYARRNRIIHREYYLNNTRLFVHAFDYKKDGSYVIYWKKGPFRKAQGNANAYYASGELWGYVAMIDGKAEGMSHNFYRNGTRLGEEPYKRGKLHGTARYYWENGQLFRECEYVKNRLVTIRGSYNKEGKPLPNGNFKNGNGELWRYDDAGEKVEKIEVYKNGKKKKTRKP